MNITINAIKFKPDSKLEEFIHEKVKKLSKQLNNVSGCDVTLKVDKPESENNKVAELHMHLPKHTLFSSKKASTFEEATDLAIDALKAQLHKLKSNPKANVSGSELSNYFNDQDKAEE